MTCPRSGSHTRAPQAPAGAKTNALLCHPGVAPPTEGSHITLLTRALCVASRGSALALLTNVGKGRGPEVK